MNVRLIIKVWILWASLCLAWAFVGPIWMACWMGLIFVAPIWIAWQIGAALTKLERWIDSLVSAWKKSVVVGPDRRGEDLDKEDK